MPDTPHLAALDGGMTLDNDVAHTQEQHACADIAEGVQQALTRLSPAHPRRGEYLALLAEFQTAAGPHARQALVLAG